MKNNMNDNLKTVLKQMLFMSDEQLTGEEIEHIDFKKRGWFSNYSWTEKREEEFVNWLEDYLKDNWEGIVESRPANKKQRLALAEEFNLSYGLKSRKLSVNDFNNIVSWGQLKEVMSSNEYKGFIEWLNGQTTSVHGVYRWDLERWLSGKKIID